jgi:hypothetical protein
MIRYAVCYFDINDLPTTVEWFRSINNGKYRNGHGYRDDGTYPEYDFDYASTSGRIEFNFKSKPSNYLYSFSEMTEDEKNIKQIKHYNSKIIIRAKNLNAFYCGVAALGYLAKLCDGNVHNPQFNTYFKGKAAIEWSRMQIYM